MMWSTGSTENIYCFGVDGLHMSAAIMHHGDPMWRAALDADFALATAAMKTHLCDVKTKIHDIEAIAHMVNANLSSQTQQREAALQQVLQRLQITAAGTLCVCGVAQYLYWIQSVVVMLFVYRAVDNALAHPINQIPGLDKCRSYRCSEFFFGNVWKKRNITLHRGTYVMVFFLCCNPQPFYQITGSPGLHFRVGGSVAFERLWIKRRPRHQLSLIFGFENLLQA